MKGKAQQAEEIVAATERVCHMHEEFQRTIDSLPLICSLLDRFANEIGLSPDLANELNLVVEELFTNMVKYTPQSNRDISISLSRDESDLIIQIIDFDVDKFDVTQGLVVDTSAPLDRRNPGGLGLHLVKTIMDTIEYKYVDRVSTITLTKHLEN